MSYVNHGSSNMTILKFQSVEKKLNKRKDLKHFWEMN